MKNSKRLGVCFYPNRASCFGGMTEGQVASFQLGIARAEPGLGPDRALTGLGLAVLSPTSPESPFSPLK